jgi:superfamily II DNA or RNA helicase
VPNDFPSSTRQPPHGVHQNVADLGLGGFGDGGRRNILLDVGESALQLARRIAELEAENRRLRELLGIDTQGPSVGIPAWKPTLFTESPTVTSQVVTRKSPPEAKVALFRSLFRGRDDVHAARWENAATGRSGWSPVVRGGWVNARRLDREYVPLDDEVVSEHLGGNRHAGLYPLRLDDSCRLLVCDFDGPGWAPDALAYFDSAQAVGASPALERSRSGAGGHVWIFFADSVPASSARRIGVFLIREAMTVRAELDLASYDRLFPAQDFLPRQGFGNLIALPLQGACRQEGTTVFLDRSTLEPYPDQWEYLSALERLGSRTAESLAQSVGELAVGLGEATYRRPARPPGERAAPNPVRASVGAALAIETIGLTPDLLAGFKHAASLPNPEFYEKERNRFWTGKTPRLIRCYREQIGVIELPRGLQEHAEQIAIEAGTRLEITNRLPDTDTETFGLSAKLRPDQQRALDCLAGEHLGVLVAPPGSGKTVIGCAVITHHSVPTLVIVDRQPLIDQWRERLSEHLGLGRGQIGQIGRNRKASGVVDLAMVQSLARRDDVAQVTARYGLVVVDECHHVPAVTFERAVRQIPVRRWLGLTATPYRRDRLESMMSMYCGPVRHRMSQPEAAQLLNRQLLVHHTTFRSIPGEPYLEVLRSIVADQVRTAEISRDIAVASGEGRNCLVLTRWTEHLDSIITSLRHHGVIPLVLRGGMGKKARRVVTDRLHEPGLRGAVLVATSGLIGEGFDCPALDTIFLAFPVKFRGSIVQHVGRILRPVPGKTDVVVHDYVDIEVPVVARLFRERARGHAELGFPVPKLTRR